MTGPENPLQSQWLPPQSGVPQAPMPSGPAPVAYAGWGTRLGAVLLDFLILFVPLMVLMIPIAVAIEVDEPGALEESTAFETIFSIVAGLATYVYYGLTMRRKGARNGQTFGKQVAGIRVVREDGKPIGFWWAAGRELVKGLISTVTLGINYLWPLWDGKNQALHDKLMKDLVVRS